MASYHLYINARRRASQTAVEIIKAESRCLVTINTPVFLAAKGGSVVLLPQVIVSREEDEILAILAEAALERRDGSLLVLNAGDG